MILHIFYPSIESHRTILGVFVLPIMWLGNSIRSSNWLPHSLGSAGHCHRHTVWSSALTQKRSKHGDSKHTPLQGQNQIVHPEKLWSTMIDYALVEASRYPKPCCNTPPLVLATWAGKAIPGLCDAIEFPRLEENNLWHALTTIKLIKLFLRWLDLWAHLRTSTAALPLPSAPTRRSGSTRNPADPVLQQKRQWHEAGAPKSDSFQNLHGNYKICVAWNCKEPEEPQPPGTKRDQAVVPSSGTHM